MRLKPFCAAALCCISALPATAGIVPPEDFLDEIAVFGEPRRVLVEEFVLEQTVSQEYVFRFDSGLTLSSIRRTSGDPGQWGAGFGQLSIIISRDYFYSFTFPDPVQAVSFSFASGTVTDILNIDARGVTTQVNPVTNRFEDVVVFEETSTWREGVREIRFVADTPFKSLSLTTNGAQTDLLFFDRVEGWVADATVIPPGPDPGPPSVVPLPAPAVLLLGGVGGLALLRRQRTGRARA